MTTIEIYGEICPDIQDTFGTVPGMLAKIKVQAAAGPAPYAVHVNSPGGSYIEALACVNFIRDLECEVIVDALAASAGTLFLCAGKTVTMRPGSLLLFHSPSCEADGTSKDMTEAALYLDKITAQVAQLYASKSGKPVEEMLALMDGETWLDAGKAVELGLCDVAEGAPVQAVAFARYAVGMKLSASAPEAVRLAADPVAFVAKMFGTEATPAALTARIAALTALEKTSAEMHAKAEETAVKLLAETEAHKATTTALATAKDAVLRFEERVAKESARMAASARVQPVVVTGQVTTSAKDLWDAYNKISDGAERTTFYRANAAAMNSNQPN